MKKRRKEPEGKYFFNSAEDTVFSGSSKMRADVHETFDLLTEKKWKIIYSDTVPLFIADYFEWLALLASGRLPPETFPSAQLRTVLSEIRSSLASGRALTPVLQRDLWRAYQEANVVTASTENGLKEKQQHDRERIEVRRRLELWEKTGSVEGAGDGEQAAQRSTQLDKLWVRIIEHE
ncbi:Uncharacterized protein APZ42_028823 [Daphnia magna]|uniref:Uncharacterized protein n=1 Tax=Daphnia magna TaxID=35525 RepID=A0A164Q5M4_9CRUS|nr:Uncharacterized protein APZ42_028823 [Daphnia magna]